MRETHEAIGLVRRGTRWAVITFQIAGSEVIGVKEGEPNSQGMADDAELEGQARFLGEADNLSTRVFGSR